MHVVATAGHVDHGKSTLVRALTGTDPDRWAEERRRGMTIDLGFAWAKLAGQKIAFVDVPGHERFVANMLAGVGPVPAAMLVVAADEGWMAQTEEHVAALDALGVRHGVAAITRSDLADPSDVTAVAADVATRLRDTSLGGVRCLPVSAVTGVGLDELREQLIMMTATLPAPDLEGPVRLWVDRSFSIRGSGTVVTGTLAAGTLRTDDELELHGRPVSVRGLESLGRRVEVATAVARVAVNIRGVEVSDVRRGDALLTAGAWTHTSTVDVRLPATQVPAQAMLHIGSAAVAVRVRPLGLGTARLTLRTPLPLRAGDRGLLRDPGRHRVVARVTVLDPGPPSLAGRGAGHARGLELADLDAASQVARHGVLSVGELHRLGLEPPVPPLVGQWVVDEQHAIDLRRRLRDAVSAHHRSDPLGSGPTVEAVRRVLGLPDRALVAALLDRPLELRGGRVVDVTRSALPPGVSAAVSALVAELADAPYRAPEAARLTALGLGSRELAAAERAGALIRLGEGVVLAAGADDAAAAALQGIQAPFSVSEARTALGTTRRVAVPLLERLDRRGLTRRGADDRRVVVPGPSAGRQAQGAG